MYKLFMIDNQAAMEQFIRQNNNKDGVQWLPQGNSVRFVKQRKETNEIPSNKIINI
jgi:hypothetical protein